MREKPSAADWYAWAAGLLEGEGSFVRCHPESRRWRIQGKMTDEDVIRRLYATFCVGRVYGPSTFAGNRKPGWAWVVDRWADVERVATVIRPFLGRRRGQTVDEMLADMRAAFLS